MIFCHKPYYNPNNTKLKKKSPNDICLKFKKIKNYVMQKKKKNTQEKIQKPNFKAFKL